MNTGLAPIVVFAYNRPDHLRKVLESLQQNPEAGSSVLYVYCDGAKPGADETTIANIARVRAVAVEKKWCKEVHVIAGIGNKGLAESVINGVEEVLARHGKAIVMEDDLVSSPYLLRYMNDALSMAG